MSREVAPPAPPDHFTLQPLETTELLSLCLFWVVYTGAQTTRGLWDWFLSLSVMFVSKMEAN